MTNSPVTTSPVAELKNKVEQRQARIAIIGPGYVGLPPALLYTEQKFRLTGFDIDQRKVLPDRYVLVTLHRPANVDDDHNLKILLECLLEVNRQLRVILPVHPRTRQRIADFGLDASQLGLREPLHRISRAPAPSAGGGHRFRRHSGGDTYLKVPCRTLRNNTERPITVVMGTNVLVGQHGAGLYSELGKVLAGNHKPCEVPHLWDGRAGQRITELLDKL